jgi:hypothetical protein
MLGLAKRTKARFLLTSTSGELLERCFERSHARPTVYAVIAPAYF